MKKEFVLTEEEARNNWLNLQDKFIEQCSDIERVAVSELKKQIEILIGSFLIWLDTLPRNTRQRISRETNYPKILEEILADHLQRNF